MRGKLQRGKEGKEGRRKKREKSKNLLHALVFPSFMTNSLTPSPLSGRHLVSPHPPHPTRPIPSRLHASLIPYLIPYPPSLLPPPSVWVTPGLVSASDPGTDPPPPPPSPAVGGPRPDGAAARHERNKK